MRYLKHWAGILLSAIYGIYALTVWLVFLFFGGALVLVLPRLAWRRIVARRALRLMFAVSLMPYRFTHLDRIPDRPCVVIANHRSFLDGLVLIAALPPRFKPVIKKEISKIPVVSKVLERVGSSFVARRPAQRAGRDTLYILDALRNSESIAIFPEGSFSPDAGLLPFREGAFLLAAKAQAPVVPVAMFGTRAVLPESNILPQPARVSVDILEPVYPGGTDDQAIHDLRYQVEQALADELHGGSSDATQSADKDDGEGAIFADYPLPLAYLDLDLLERNLRLLLERSGGKNLRVDAHVLQCPTVVQRVLRSNARFTGAFCATVPEALRLLDYPDIADVLIGFPTVAPDTLERACQTLADGKQMTFTIDSLRHIRPIAAAAQRAGVTAPLVVEIDISSNLPGFKGPSRRSAIRHIEPLLQLVTTIADTPGVSFSGISSFDTRRNHLIESSKTAVGQHSPARDRNKRSRRQVRKIRERREAIVAALHDRGQPPAIFSCDGNHAPKHNALDGSITEMIVGDVLYGLDPADPEDIPAAGFAAEVIRQPGDTLYACLGGGTTCASTADRAMLPEPFSPRGVRLDPLFGVGKGQLPIRYDGKLEIGDTVYMRPANAAELCERFNRLLLIQDGAIVGQADTDRALSVGDDRLSPSPAPA